MGEGFWSFVLFLRRGEEVRFPLVVACVGEKKRARMPELVQGVRLKIACRLLRVGSNPTPSILSFFFSSSSPSPSLPPQNIVGPRSPQSQPSVTRPKTTWTCFRAVLHTRARAIEARDGERDRARPAALSPWQSPPQSAGSNTPTSTQRAPVPLLLLAPRRRRSTSSHPVPVVQLSHEPRGSQPCLRPAGVGAENPVPEGKHPSVPFLLLFRGVGLLAHLGTHLCLGPLLLSRRLHQSRPPSLPPSLPHAAPRCVKTPLPLVPLPRRSSLLQTDSNASPHAVHTSPSRVSLTLSLSLSFLLGPLHTYLDSCRVPLQVLLVCRGPDLSYTKPKIGLGLPAAP